MPGLAVAILEVMWDWEARTSGAGYNHAPSYFKINPRNHTGRRLYDWLGHRNLLVTDACPELVSSPSEKGTPDPEWLDSNLTKIQEERGLFDLLLVCGNVAQKTLERCDYMEPFCRTVYCPHPAARTWTSRSLKTIKTVIQTGTISCHARLNRSGRLVVNRLHGRIHVAKTTATK